MWGTCSDTAGVNAAVDEVRELAEVVDDVECGVAPAATDGIGLVESPTLELVVARREVLCCVHTAGFEAVEEEVPERNALALTFTCASATNAV